MTPTKNNNISNNNTPNNKTRPSTTPKISALRPQGSEMLRSSRDNAAVAPSNWKPQPCGLSRSEMRQLVIEQIG